VSRHLLSPRGAPPAPEDRGGGRAAFMGRQKIGAAGRRRAPARQAAARARRRRHLAAWVSALAAGLAVVAPVYWALTSPRFAVASVEVRGASRVPAERIAEAAGIAAGVNLWRVDPAGVVARVEALPEIRRADVVRELPNRVTIHVEERQPFTLVSTGRLHWLDEEGYLLGEERRAVTPPVPVISGLAEQELEAMRTAPSPRVRQAIALIRTLLASGGRLAAEIAEIDMSRGDGPVLYTVDGIEVRLGTEEWEARLARLEGVLGQVAAQGGVRAIDLRFRDQVVLTKGGPG
jgi:cell division septal protein FtsQ